MTKSRSIFIASAIGIAGCIAVFLLIRHHDDAAVANSTNNSPTSASHVNRWKQSEEHLRRGVSHLRPREFNTEYRKIPFALLDGQPIYLNSAYRAFSFINGIEVAFPGRGVPIDIKEHDGNYDVAFREIFSGRLFRLTYSRSGQLLQEKVFEWHNPDPPIFRGAVSSPKGLHWVVYDNKDRKNYLVNLEASDTEGFDRIQLPTFFPPAGVTYEMEPPVFITAFGDDWIQLVAGAQLFKVGKGHTESIKLPGCETAVEAVFSSTGPVVLCRSNSTESAAFFVLYTDEMLIEKIPNSKGVPWGMTYSESEKKAKVRYANTAPELREMFINDLVKNQHNGLLEFGISNIEGRIPWSQIYYLNGLLDALLLARLHLDADDIFNPISDEIIDRIIIEVEAIDDLLDRAAGFHTKGFTVDRSPALFAVQTSRLLLLFDRYHSELVNPPKLKNVERLRKMVLSLDGHIEILETAENSANKNGTTTTHLAWPKCSPFYFDGLPVPFNHQNEWAYSVFEGAKLGFIPKNSARLEAPKDIIRFFVDQVSNANRFPDIDRWPYWYGNAAKGWAIEEDLSCNTPSYAGDRGLAWISFRSIDFMSVMASITFIPELHGPSLVSSGSSLIETGKLYPFSARSLLDYDVLPRIQSDVLRRYSRATAPWEISNSVWAVPLGLHTNE